MKNALISVTENLVEVTRQKIGSEEVNAVNARDLWVHLESKRQFADWIKQRIEDYDFVQGTDYISFQKIVKRENSSGATKSTEYIISLDMAKELSMVERNEKGKAARRYFIECEKKSKAVDYEMQIYLDRFRKYMMLDVPMVWEKLYPDSFFIALMKLHGHEFKGNSSTPSYCSKIINDWVYKIVLPAEIHKEIGSSSGVEKRHQWFTQQNGRRILANQIDKVELIANCSDSRAMFEAHCKRTFTNTRQLKLTLG